MPIYAYKCNACGFAKDVLQKMSDAPLAVCPECGAHAFHKQVTAAGFQLKGSGWYVTDFRGGNKGGAPAAGSEKGNGAGADTPAAPASAAGEGAAVAAKPAAADSPAPAPAPAAAASKG